MFSLQFPKTLLSQCPNTSVRIQSAPQTRWGRNIHPTLECITARRVERFVQSRMQSISGGREGCYAISVSKKEVVSGMSKWTIGVRARTSPEYLFQSLSLHLENSSILRISQPNTNSRSQCLLLLEAGVCEASAREIS